MNLIVIEKEEELFVSLDTIAMYAEVDEKSIKDLITRKGNDFKSHGLNLDNLPKLPNGQRDWKTLTLTEPQATFLLMLMKNTDVVTQFKSNLVKEFYRMRQNITIRHKAELEQLRRIERTVNTYDIGGREFSTARGVNQLSEVDGERHFKENMKEAGLVYREFELRPVWKPTEKGIELNMISTDKMGTVLYDIERCSQLSNQIDDM